MSLTVEAGRVGCLLRIAEDGPTESRTAVVGSVRDTWIWVACV